jgi:uncharacterized membrane protein
MHKKSVIRGAGFENWLPNSLNKNGRETADKFVGLVMLYFTKQVCRPSADPADKLVGWLEPN